MDSRTPNTGRTVVFRLDTIPPELRRKAAAEVVAAIVRSDEHDFLWRIEEAALVRAAAEQPSRRSYAVPAAAWERVMGAQT